MFASFLQTLLPGIRDMRTPLVAGFLWLALGWLLAAAHVGPLRSTSGFVSQAFELSTHVGPGSTLAALSLVAYVVGVLGVTMADGLRRVVLPGLAAVNVGRLRRVLVPILGPGTVDDPRRTTEAANDILQGLIELVARRAADDELRSRTGDMTATSSSIYYTGELGRQIEAHLDYDPLDLLRTVDDALFQALDRERSEREFRVAVTPAVAAICLYLAFYASAWAWIGVALSVATFARSAVVQQAEAWRVANLVALRGLPAQMREAAESAGRLGAGAQVANSARQAKAKSQ